MRPWTPVFCSSGWAAEIFQPAPPASHPNRILDMANPSDRALLRRLASFTDDPAGGNPAGVWVGEALPPAAEMQRIAAEVGYSETAFVAPDGDGFLVRYYSPEAEVSFCGHATVATGVVLGQLHGPGRYALHTAVGEVPVVTELRDGRAVAALTSVATKHEPAAPRLLADALAAFGWGADVLDPAIPPVRAFAGAWHLVLALREAATLEALRYDFDRLKRIMADADLTTVQVVWREGPELFHSRNPFPPGGVVEDPATGAAAAALGGYLRDAKLIETPARFTIIQGVTMGRPSRIEVRVPATGGVTVEGAAVDIEPTG